MLQVNEARLILQVLRGATEDLLSMYQLFAETHKTKEQSNILTLPIPKRPKGIFDGNCYIVSTVECAGVLLENVESAFDNGFFTDHETLESRLVAFVLEADAIEHGRATFGKRFATISIQGAPFRRWDLVMEVTRRMGNREYDLVIFESEGKEWFKQRCTGDSLRGDVSMRIHGE